MVKEEKELLLKDLCARLPYNMFVEKDGRKCAALTITNDGEIEIERGIGYYRYYDIQDVRPYLRPMSSVTEAEKNELRNLLRFGYPSDDFDVYSHRGIEIKNCLYNDEDKSEYDFEDFELLKEFLLKNHFDYRGLIPMGLALEASEDMYK